MTLQDIIADIHALTEDLEVYERKYGILSQTFHTLYTSGVEPDNEAWVLDWGDWAGTFQIRQRRQAQYERTIDALREQHSMLAVIKRSSGREPIPVAS